MLDIAASHVKPGVTTDMIDEVVHNACIERGAYPAPLNYRGFPKSVCLYVPLILTIRTKIAKLPSRRSVNEVICHGIPDQRKLQEGDIVNIGTC